MTNKPWIEIKESDQKRLRRAFGNDNRIHWGYNKETHRYESWYVPSSSAPYMITMAENVEHAMHLMRGKARLDQMRAKDYLREIDEHNDNLLAGKQADGMQEVRSQLKTAAVGKRYFTPITRGRAYTRAGKGL